MSKLLFIASDHAAFDLKKQIKKYLTGLGYQVKDFGAYSYNPEDDYPDFIFPAAQAMAKHKGSRGIMLGGSGLGECIVANKIKGVRAVRAWDIMSAKMSRAHNDANVLCLGAGKTKDKAAHGMILTLTQAKSILNIWLKTPFSGKLRHIRRLKKISQYEA